MIRLGDIDSIAQELGHIIEMAFHGKPYYKQSPIHLVFLDTDNHTAREKAKSFYKALKIEIEKKRKPVGFIYPAH